MARYFALLKYQSRIGRHPEFDEQTLADLDAEFRGEDRDLVEAGLADYACMLDAEDAE